MNAHPDWLDRTRWPFEPRRYDDSDGVMHYVDEGDGPVILFSHGTPTWSLDWAPLMKGLAGRARCIAVDHLGFGLSGRPDAAYAPEDHAARFARFAEHLDLSDVTLVVHDFGGPIALPWAVENPDRLRRIVVVNTWAWSLDDVAHVAGPARFLASGLGRWLYGAFNLSVEMVAASAWADKSHWRAMVDQIRPVFPDAASRKQVLWALARSLLASSGHYAALETKLRDLPASVARSVVWGTQDPAFPTFFRDRWLEIWPGAHRVDIEAGHWPHVEQPGPLNAHLLALVDQN